MSNGLIAFLASLSASVWFYTKMQRKTGGNTTNSLIVAGSGGVILFVVIFLLLGLIPSA